MVVYGLGMGLTSAPATEAIMGAVSRATAGVGSAVNDTTRLVGGTLGVAVIGSVYASAYGSRLAGTLPAAVPAQAAALARQSVGAAYTAAGTLTASGHPAAGQALHQASTSAFLPAHPPAPAQEAADAAPPQQTDARGGAAPMAGRYLHRRTHWPGGRTRSGRR